MKEIRVPPQELIEDRIWELLDIYALGEAETHIPGVAKQFRDKAHEVIRDKIPRIYWLYAQEWYKNQMELYNNPQ